MRWFKINFPASNMRDVIGLFLTIAFIGAMVALLWKAIPPENEQLLAYMLGQLSGFVAGVVGYHYITKSGEKELEQSRTDNTGKALDAIHSLAADRPKGTPDDPVSVDDQNGDKK